MDKYEIYHKIETMEQEGLEDTILYQKLSLDLALIDLHEAFCDMWRDIFVWFLSWIEIRVLCIKRWIRR